MKPHENSNVLSECAVGTIPAPKIEMSGRFQQLMKELDITEKLLNETLWNVCLETYERDENIKEPECHLQSLDALENRVYWIQRIAEKLNSELR